MNARSMCQPCHESVWPFSILSPSFLWVAVASSQMQALDQLTREGKRSQEEVHGDLYRWWRPHILEGTLLLLDLRSPLLLSMLDARRLVCEEFHPAQQDVLGKPQIAVLPGYNTVCKDLTGLAQGSDHIRSGLLDLLERLIVYHRISPYLCLYSQMPANVHA